MLSWDVIGELGCDFLWIYVATVFLLHLFVLVSVSALIKNGFGIVQCRCGFSI